MSEPIQALDLALAMGKVGSIVAALHALDQPKCLLSIELLLGQHDLQQDPNLRHRQGRCTVLELQSQPDIDAATT